MRFTAFPLLCFGAITAFGGPAWGQLRSHDVALGLEGVGITQNLGAQLPAQEVFTNHTGKKSPLADFLAGELPVILTFNYANCPQLCNLQLDSLVGTLNNIPLLMGKDFRMVSVSVDPRETPESFGAFRNRLLQGYNQEITPSAWQFLVGEESAIQSVAKAAGFGYNFDPKREEFAHSAALILLGKDRTISRYLGGVSYEPQTLRLSLIESSKGAAGSLFDQAFLTCFYYDPDSNSYAPVALAFTRIGAALTVILLAGLLVRAFRRNRPS